MFTAVNKYGFNPLSRIEVKIAGSGLNSSAIYVDEHLLVTIS